MSVLGENIKKARNSAGLTQKQLAEKISKGFSTVQKYELGILEPSFSIIEEIAAALDIRAGVLLGWETVRDIIPGRLRIIQTDDPNSEYFRFDIQAEDKEAYQFGLDIFQRAGALPKEARKEIEDFFAYLESRWSK